MGFLAVLLIAHAQQQRINNTAVTAVRPWRGVQSGPTSHRDVEEANAARPRPTNVYLTGPRAGDSSLEQQHQEQ